MRKLYEAADRIEAQRLVDFLRDEAVPAVLLGDALSGAGGELPVNIYPAVWLVEDAHWLRARGLLVQFLEPAHEASLAWKCPGCGEMVEGAFEVCWNCSTARPE